MVSNRRHLYIIWCIFAIKSLLKLHETMSIQNQSKNQALATNVVRNLPLHSSPFHPFMRSVNMEIFNDCLMSFVNPRCTLPPKKIKDDFLPTILLLALIAFQNKSHVIKSTFCLEPKGRYCNDDNDNDNNRCNRKWFFYFHEKQYLKCEFRDDDDVGRNFRYHFLQIILKVFM